MKIGSGLCQSKSNIKNIKNKELTNEEILNELNKLNQLSKKNVSNNNLLRELEENNELNKELKEIEEELKREKELEEENIIISNFKGGNKDINNYSSSQLTIAKILYYIKIYKNCFDNSNNKSKCKLIKKNKDELSKDELSKDELSKVYSNLNILLDNLLNELCSLDNNDEISKKIIDIKRVNNCIYKYLKNNYNKKNDINEIINRLLDKSIEYIKIIYKIYT